MATCMISGCGKPASNKLGIRCRKPSTRAVWAPNFEAYLCTDHAQGGVDVTISVEAAANQHVNAIVESGGKEITSRSTIIRRRAA